ncbi:MAG: sugar kinase [Nannocystis sp.]|uniref:PfkB family carbohydrate kinase n=1 Tax=Nannocystis sp. TaxID=1962667 RepID=UPI002429019A|nr:PfkB family carbohydrate kinase [Nannocystis sp.]MBK9753704.1 sugar kinase [Nannocystis sp.]
MHSSNPHLLVVGSVAIDWIITPHAEREESVGGSATFFAMAASYLSRVRLVGVVGGDFPQAAIGDLRDRGVDLTGLEVIADGKTFRWKGRYHENMNDRTTLATDLNVFESFTPKLPPEFRGSDFLFLANIQPKLQEQVFTQMQRPRLVGLDTMNLWISIANEELRSVLRHVDVLTLNDEEARQLSGEHNLVKAARGVQRLGPKNLVIKRGESGALLFDHEGHVFAAPALPLEEVIDPTGAGDSFAGGFMGYLARPGVEPTGASLRTAMIYGSVMASFCVEGFSYDRLRQLDTASIQHRFEAFSSLTNFARANLLD